LKTPYCSHVPIEFYGSASSPIDQDFRREVAMSVVSLGYVKSPSGRSFEVKWDASSHELYVGGHRVGKAYSPTEAMQKAEAWVYNK
jgi:hypothetical protein